MSVADSSAPRSAGEVPSSGPYVGPRPFERDEEHLFFGRDREARDLISLIIANRIFVLYSQSGAGKSSLLNTKVITGLEKERCWVLPIARVQGKVPAGTNEAEIRNVFSLNTILSLRDAVPGLLVDSLTRASVAEFLSAIYPHATDAEEPVVLIFDQFEELFSFYEYRWRDRAEFLKEILEALARFSELRVVFSLREDYIAKLDAFSGDFPNKLRARYHLERLQEAAALEAISEPAKKSGREYAPGVVEAIVHDLLQTHSLDISGKSVTVAGEFIEPVQLQVVCSNLWSSVPPNETLITQQHLKAFGNVDEALRKFYDASVARIASQAKVSELEIRRWFDRALFTSAGTRGTVFRDVETTAGMSNKVVDLLEDCHLIRGDWRAGAQWYEITHDRLLRPIRESNRIRLEKARQASLLKVGIPAVALALGVLIALVLSLNYSHQASRRVDAQILASALVDASSKLPQNNIDLALLLAIEAFRAQDSTSTRSNLLAQMLKADRIERIERISTRDLVASAVIPGSDLVASVTSDRNLLVWKRTGEIVSQYPVTGEAPFNLFADRTSIYVIPNRGEGQTFNANPAGKEGSPPIQGASVLGQLKEAVEDASASANRSNLDLPQAVDPDIRRNVAYAAGTLLVARQGQIIITNTSDHSEISRFPVANDIANRRAKVLDVGLSPNGKFAFAASCESDETKSDKANSLPSQTRVPVATTTCVRRTVKFWQVGKKSELFIPGNSAADFAQSIAIGDTDGGIWIAAGKSDGSVNVGEYQLDAKDLSGLRPLVAIPLTVGTPIADLLFSERSSELLSISGGQAISWNLTKPRRLEQKLRDGLPFDIATGGDGRLAYIGAKGYFVLSRDDQRELFSGANTSPADWTPDLAAFASVWLAHDRLLVGQFGAIDLWSTAERNNLASISIAPAATVSVALDPLGQYFASGYLPPWVRDLKDIPATPTDFSHVPIMWMVDGRQPVVFADLTPAPAAAKPAPVPDKNPTEQKPQTPDTAPTPEVSKALLAVAVAFSPDGQNFVVTKSTERADGSIEIYKRSGRGAAVPFVKLPPIQTEARPYFVAISGDGKMLAVSQSSGEIMLVDLEGKVPPGKLPSAGGEGGRLAISPDNSKLAVIGGDGSAILWDIATRTPFGRPIGLGDASMPTGVAFSPDGRRLLAGDANLNSMVAFDLDVGSWIDQACQVTGRTLSVEERRNYNVPADGPRTCASP